MQRQFGGPKIQLAAFVGLRVREIGASKRNRAGSELLSLPNSTAALNLSPQRKREMLFEALLHQLAAVARSRPVLMVFEDGHWSDPSSRELLDLTLDRVSRLPVLLVVSFRPEFQHAWSSQPHVTMLTLNRLGGRDGAVLVERLAGAAGLAREIVDEIVERADGVPLFVEELTKAVLESGGRDNRVAAVLASSPLPALAIPATLHASLIARLDRLGPIAKELGQIGAVIGREFGYELMEQVAQWPTGELRLGLDRLVEAGLLFCRGVAPQSFYFFKHALVQDAAYSTLLRARRRELHARVAAAIVERFPQLEQSQPELIAHHYTEADDKEQAAVFWYQAGRQANARFAIHEASAHFTKGLELLSGLPAIDERDRRELDFQLAFAVPLIAMHGFGSEQVEVCARRARDLADKAGDNRSQFLAHRFVWNSCLLRRPVPEAVALARTLMDLARKDNEPARLTIAHRALGFSTQIAGALAEADQLLAGGIALADRVPDTGFAVYGEHPGMVCRVYRAQTRCLMGYLDDAVQLAEAGIEHARTRNSPFNLAWSLIVAAQLHLFLRDAAAAERTSREAIALSREHRLPQWMAFAQNSLGRAMCCQGQPRKGIELQEEGMRSLHAVGSVFQTTLFRLQLAESCFELAEPDRARSQLDAAFAHLQAHREMWLMPELCRVQLMLLCAEAAPNAALEQPIKKGLDIARSQGARLLELRLATRTARLWGEQDRRAEARDLLAPVYGWFTEGFDTPDLQEAKALLDQLG